MRESAKQHSNALEEAFVLPTISKAAMPGGENANPKYFPLSKAVVHLHREILRE
jgi:hypothetical protein